MIGRPQKHPSRQIDRRQEEVLGHRSVYVYTAWPTQLQWSGSTGGGDSLQVTELLLSLGFAGHVSWATGMRVATKGLIMRVAMQCCNTYGHSREPARTN